MRPEPRRTCCDTAINEYHLDSCPGRPTPAPGEHQPTLAAGQHPVPLDQVHADLGPEGLYRHLVEDHDRHVDRRLGAAVHQHAHRVTHEGQT